MNLVTNLKRYISFENVFVLLLILLPFHVIISVFLQYKLWIPWAWLYKELLLFILWILLIYKFYSLNKKPSFDKLDYLIFWYFIYLILISIIKFYSVKAIVYWWRYDFEFLLIFLIVRHWSFLLKEKLSHYIKVFLISAWIAILSWIIVRFIIWEWVLVYFGFSSHISSWSITEWPPIYHGVEWANVRRFQWIFDWPNQAAFLLIVFSGLLFHYMKNKKDKLFYLYSILFVCFWLVFFTYTRSALIWIILSLGFIFVLNFKLFLTKYRKESITALVFIAILGSVFYIRYWGNMWEIVWRASSTKWHYERMIIWFNQFLGEPLWRGLSSSWPWYRLTRDTVNVDEKNFIPESWYIQQLVEWWIIGFILFVSIMWIIALTIYNISIPVFFSFIAVLVMNLLLHTFEASYISMLLFMILWLFLKKKYTYNTKK